MIIKKEGDPCSFCGKSEGVILMDSSETKLICTICISKCFHTVVNILHDSINCVDELKAIIHNTEIGEI